jgi:hypothetical protein
MRKTWLHILLLDVQMQGVSGIVLARLIVRASAACGNHFTT